MISKRSAGFTLLELMTAVGISAILLAIAVPAFRNITVNSQLTAQVNRPGVGAERGALRGDQAQWDHHVLPGDPRDQIPRVRPARGIGRNWIVRTSGGTVLRRGTVATDSAIAVVSDLDTDTMTFSSRRAGQDRRCTGDLENVIRVSTTKLSRDNLRCITARMGQPDFH